MKIFIDKDQCEITNSINGRVAIIETHGPIYIEEINAKMLLHSQWDDDFGIADKPFLAEVPEDYKI